MMSAPNDQAPGMAPGREALPMPCLGCGAPMVAAQPAPGLHGSPILTCRFCGASEAMPDDAAAQDRFLRLRLMQVRRAREGLEAPLKTLEMVRQSWAFALVIFAVMGGWQLWQAISTAGQAPLESTVFGAAGASGVVGAIFGYFGMIRAFRVLVKPLLQARPAATQGLSARCRTCGGDLPRANAPKLQCGYCGADNFLDAAHAQDVTRLLAEEQAEYQRRAHGGHPPDGSAYQQPAKAFYRWGAVGAAGTFIVTVVLMVVLAR